MTDERRERGRALRLELLGDQVADEQARTIYDDPMMQKFGEYTIDAIFGGLWARPGLDLKARTLICVVSDVVTTVWPELRVHLRMARRQGWSEDELVEALLHMVGYVGAPKVREAMIIAREEFEALRSEAES